MSFRKYSHFVDASSLEAFAERCQLPPGVLGVIESNQVGLGLEAATDLANSWVSEEALGVDLKLSSPDSDRWTVAEVNEKVISPSNFVAIERNIIVVDRAHAMDESCADRLLKTVEEPSSLSTFLFIVNDINELIPTLRSRASWVLRLKPSTKQEQIAHLISQGEPENDARRAVEASGNQIALPSILLSDIDLLNMAEDALTVHLGVVDPVEQAQKTLENLTVLSNVLLTEGKSRSTKIDASSRPVLREMIREFLDRHKKAAAQLVTTDPTIENLRLASLVLTQADEAIRQIRFYTSPQLSLTAFYANLKGESNVHSL